MKVARRFDPQAIPAVQAALAAGQAALGEQGRIVLRPSGTEPLIRVMVEAREEPLARACAERLAEVVRSVA